MVFAQFAFVFPQDFRGQIGSVEDSADQPDGVALLDHDDLELPKVRVSAYTSDDVCRSFDEASRRVKKDRDERSDAVKERLRRRSESRDQAYWANRLRPGARVLGFTSRFTTMLQYSMRDIGAALEEHGYEFRMVMEPANHVRSTELSAAKQMDEFDPALVILLNHFRCELPQPWVGVPVLTWVQDPTDLVFSNRVGSSIGPLDFVCGYYADHCVEEFGYPRRRFFSIPFIPVSSSQFHDAELAAPDIERFECDAWTVWPCRKTTLPRGSSRSTVSHARGRTVARRFAFGF